MARRGRGEGSISRRSIDGRWVAAVSLGPGRGRKWFYGGTRQEVAGKLKVALREQQLGRLAAGAAPRLGDFLDGWLSRLQRRPNTIDFYRGTLGHIPRELRRIRLNELMVADVQRLVDGVAKEVSPSRADDVRVVLRTALRAAERQDLVGRNVAALTEPVKVDRPEASYWKAAQARRFLETIRGHELEALFLIMLALGLRPSEALAIRRQDIDLDAGELHIRLQVQPARRGRPATLAPVKTARSRAAVPLPPLVMDPLRAALVEGLRVGRHGADGLLFANRRAGLLSLDDVRRRFYALVSEAGLPRIKLYDATRHTAASVLAAAGVHPSVAQRILRHADIQTTLRFYTHVGWEQVVEAAGVIDRELRRRSP